MVIIFISILDLIGTAAFAISGAMIGIKKRLDIFGVFVLSVLTASGGGIIRDIIIHKNAPIFFTSPKYLIVITFFCIIACLGYKYLKLSKINLVFQIFDAIGLGIFTVLAGYIGIVNNMPFIGVVFLSVICGVGGGILRDVMVMEIPSVLKSEIYAVASIIGSVLFFVLYGYLNTTILMYLCSFVVVLIRILSIYFNVNLPIVKQLISS